MAFERSPGLDGTPQHRGLITWIFDHKRTMYIASAIAAGLLIAVLAFLLISSQPRDLVAGGLDGCIVSPTDDPVAATARIADQTAATQDDGCFFFASVPPGDHTLVLRLDDGTVVQRKVTIVPGQATMLGNITLSQ